MLTPRSLGKMAPILDEYERMQLVIILFMLSSTISKATLLKIK